MPTVAATPARHGRLIAKLLLGVAAAFAFAFALVPLYDTFCRALGLNGKTFVRGGLDTADGAPARAVDTSRIVTVDFIGTVMPGLPWDLRPLDTHLDLHPGELQHTRFLVRNTGTTPSTGQAVPSVTPGQAAAHFEKIECFCFTQQTLLPGEAREMPLAFIVKPGLSADVRTISLAYAFYPAQASTPNESGTSRGD